MIGDKLEALLAQKKIKAGTLASITGIPKSTIYSIIKRNNKNVDFSVMDKIADALDVPVEYFFDRSEDNRNANSDYVRYSLSSSPLTPDEQQLLTSYRELSPQGKEYILQTLDMASKVYIKPDCLPEMATDIG